MDSPVYRPSTSLYAHSRIHYKLGTFFSTFQSLGHLRSTINCDRPNGCLYTLTHCHSGTGQAQSSYSGVGGHCYVFASISRHGINGNCDSRQVRFSQEAAIELDQRKSRAVAKLGVRTRDAFFIDVRRYIECCWGIWGRSACRCRHSNVHSLSWLHIHCIC